MNRTLTIDNRHSALGNRLKTFVRVLTVLLLVVYCCLSPARAQETKGDDVIRVETDLVGFEVTITDRDGKPVRGLAAKDFKIYEDGAERSIDFFEPLKKNNDSRPLAVALTLDVSGSMTADEMARLRGAVKTFIDRLADYNSYFSVITFGMEVKTLQSFTNKPEKLEKTFAKLTRDENGLSSHAYDAVDDAVRQLKKKAPQTSKNKLVKRVVVLVTDGFPVGDTVSPKTVIERANDAETSVYTIILPSFSRLQGNRKPLPTPLEVSGLVEKTGGKSFYANEKNFEPLFKSLAEEITSSYILAFYPNGEAGKFRKVKIEVPLGFRVVQNRDGYRLKQ